MKNKMIVRSTDNRIAISTWMLGREKSLEMRSVVAMEAAAKQAGWWMDYLNRGQARVTVQTETVTEIERGDGMVVRFSPATLEDIEYTAERGNFGPGAVTIDYIR